MKATNLSNQIHGFHVYFEKEYNLFLIISY